MARKKIQPVVQDESTILPTTNSILTSLQTVPYLPIPDDKDKEIDKVADISQKEKRLHAAGVTRAKAYAVVAEALVAVDRRVVADASTRFKEVVVETINVPRRQWGAEMAAKYFGDLVEKKVGSEVNTLGLFAVIDGKLRGRMITVDSATVDTVNLPTDRMPKP